MILDEASCACVLVATDAHLACGHSVATPGQPGLSTRGATAVEYGLILALIFLAIVGSIQAVANSTTGMWNDVSAKVVNAR